MLGSLELREIAGPHLRQLTEETGHTSNLAIRYDTAVILIDRVRGRPGRYHHLEFTLHVGSRLPAYRSATGKALLADLEQVRRTGVAANDEELESALRPIAAPVRGLSGEAVAAINVAILW
jgi:DNA-binding IclR family transcriptional regulator